MKDKTIKLLITGDFCPINRVEELVVKGNYELIFNDFIDVFRGNDLNILDLECPLTKAETKRPKTGPYQKGNPKSVEAMKFAGINLVAMANNHIMDYNTEGVEDTLKLCRTHDIHTVGIGKNMVEASKPYLLDASGKKVAIFNIADEEFLKTTDESYTCSSIDTIRLFNDIQNIHDKVDYIVFLVHAGNEFYELPSPRTKNLYRYIIDLGADAVISHHTHVFSGFEVYKSKPIFYGLGNFIYDWPGKSNEKWNNGYVVRLRLSDTLDFDIIPLKQSNETPGVFQLNDKESDSFFKELYYLSRIIADDELLENAFKSYCDKVFPMYSTFIEPNFGKYISALQNRNLLPRLLSKQKKLLLLNLTRCESHRDVLTRMLNRYGY